MKEEIIKFFKDEPEAWTIEPDMQDLMKLRAYVLKVIKDVVAEENRTRPESLEEYSVQSVEGGRVEVVDRGGTFCSVRCDHI